MRPIVLLAAVALLSCGIETAPQTTATSTAPLCGTEPHVNAGGTVSAIGCPFEQQWQNITNHGTHLVASEQLSSAGTLPGVSVTDSCGAWLLGLDSNGLTVFVNTQSGEVRSHGQFHPGFATSSLPATLLLPVSAQPAAPQ